MIKIISIIIKINNLNFHIKVQININKILKLLK